MHIYLYGRIARILKQRVYIITCNGRIQEENANLPCKIFSKRPTTGIPTDSTGQQKLLAVTKTEEYLSHTRAAWSGDAETEHSQVTNTEEYLTHISEQLELGLGDVATD